MATVTAAAGSGDGADGGPKLWGGRFKKPLDPEMEKFNASIGYDKVMWSADIDGSIAYAKALAKTTIISEAERDKLCEGLEMVISALSLKRGHMLIS